MSRQSDAKKARRRKRQAARESNWIPQPLLEEVRAAAESDPIAEALADVDDWIASRGWVLDGESSENVVSWVYPPSAGTDPVDDEDREPVTRIWITIDEDDDEVVLAFGAVLVGAGSDDDTYVLDPDNLADGIAALERYRPGLPRPELA